MGRNLRAVICFVSLMLIFHSGLQAQIVEDENAPTEAEFLEKNKMLQSLRWKGRHVLVLILKSGKSEVYDLNTEKGNKKIYDKYGSHPQAPTNYRESRRQVPGKSS